MTPLQRRVVLAVCLIVALSLLMGAGLTFLVAPMADGLGFSDEQVEDILALPSVGSLLAVFSAGYLGDRLGQRRTLALSALLFSAGALLLAVARGAVMVEVGLAVCAAAAITAQIVGASLLQRTTVSGPAQVSAFTSYGMVFPIAFLALPVATAGLLGVASWRVVPMVWVIAGALMLVLALGLLRPDDPAGSPGEWITPVLAGIALAGFARGLAELGHIESDPRIVIVGLVVGAAAALACLVLMRTRARASFSFAPVGDRVLRVLLLCVGLVSFVGLLTFVSIALEYLYDLTPLEASIAIVPAQLGAVLGAKVLASRAIHRWGGVRAARTLMLAIAVAMLPMLVVQADSPAWYLVGVAAIFSCAGMGALTVLNTEVMRRAPTESTGSVSSFRTAASSLGAAFGVGVFGTIIISSVQVDAGIDAVSTAQLDQLAASLRLVGALAGATALIGWLVLRTARDRQTDTAA